MKPVMIIIQRQAMAAVELVQSREPSSAVASVVAKVFAIIVSRTVRTAPQTLHASLARQDIIFLQVQPVAFSIALRSASALPVIGVHHCFVILALQVMA